MKTDREIKDEIKRLRTIYESLLSGPVSEVYAQIIFLRERFTEESVYERWDGPGEADTRQAALDALDWLRGDGEAPHKQWEKTT